VDAVTVSSRALQRRYGGTLIRHGPDEAVFAPAPAGAADGAATRQRYGLPSDRRLAVFCGVPRRHKGWLTLVEALVRPEAAAWDLVAAGAPDSPWHHVARERLGGRFHVTGLLPRTEVAAVLRAADAAPVPQERTPFAESQLPAKLLEAMAVGTPALATRVGDLAELLGEGERGWLVPPGDAAALAAALAEIARQPERAVRCAAAARAWFLTEAGIAANRERLGAVVRRVLAAHAAQRAGETP
jgi:glycosyltransferase involved in cell wall biosynthesis